MVSAPQPEGLLSFIDSPSETGTLHSSELNVITTNLKLLMNKMTTSTIGETTCACASHRAVWGRTQDTLELDLTP